MALRLFASAPYAVRPTFGTPVSLALHPALVSRPDCQTVITPEIWTQDEAITWINSSLKTVQDAPSTLRAPSLVWALSVKLNCLLLTTRA